MVASALVRKRTAMTAISFSAFHPLSAVFFFSFSFCCFFRQQMERCLTHFSFPSICGGCNSMTVSSPVSNTPSLKLPTHTSFTQYHHGLSLTKELASNV